MKRYVRPVAALLLMAIAALAISACGSSSSKKSSGSSGGSTSTAASGNSGSSSGSTPTINYVERAYPQSLDPGDDYTTQGAEVNWLVYTGLLTYHHESGTAGAQLMPGLATALPKITDGGKTYTMTLRSGQTYSNGAPVKARDFLYTFERAVKIPWGGAGEFMTPVVVGAQAFSTGKAKTISGIQTNNKTGKIVIHLTAPYGAFENVLAEPALGLIPYGSAPFKNEPSNPPPGDGPYMVKNITVDQSYDVVKNPHWHPIPGIPSGHVNIDVKINTNVTANAEAVLNNTADVFDWADTIPGSLLAQIHAKAADRYKLVDLGGSTYYFFLNAQEKPFNNQYARAAVVAGLNQNALNRIGGGTLDPGCYFLSPAIIGHVNDKTDPCPYGTPGNGNMAKAKALMKKSGMIGQPVTVWSQEAPPRSQWMQYYTQYLNQLGFKATIKEISDTTYFATIGERKLHPQTGFADWNQDFPNPIDFYGVLLDGNAILPTNNENFGEVNDPVINKAVTNLGKIPTTQLRGEASKWQAVEKYVARKAYVAVFGYQKFPFFMSDRMNFSAAIQNPIYGWDWSSFELK